MVNVGPAMVNVGPAMVNVGPAMVNVGPAMVNVGPAMVNVGPAMVIAHFACCRFSRVCQCAIQRVPVLLTAFRVRLKLNLDKIFKHFVVARLSTHCLGPKNMCLKNYKMIIIIFI